VPLAPADQNLRPLCRWTPLQTHPLSPEALARTWLTTPDANIGLVTGPVSRLVVLDVDPRNGGTESLAPYRLLIPDGPRARTPRGGTHHYFAHSFLSHQLALPTITPLRPGLDLLSHRHLVTAPPSVRRDGGYGWESGFELTRWSLPLVPWWVFYLIAEHQKQERAQRQLGQLSPEQRALLPQAIADVLPHLQRVERTPTGWKASCPTRTHGKGEGDQRQSLSISIGTRRPLVMNCFAGCSFADIVLALVERRTVTIPPTAD
jgi:hypothetical protein